MNLFRPPATLRGTTARAARRAVLTGVALAVAAGALPTPAQAATSTASQAAPAATRTVRAAALPTPLVVHAPAAVLSGSDLPFTVSTRPHALLRVEVYEKSGKGSIYQRVSDATGRAVVLARVTANGRWLVYVNSDATHTSATGQGQYVANGVLKVTMVAYYKTVNHVVYYHPGATLAANKAYFTVGSQWGRQISAVGRLQYKDSTGWHWLGTTGTRLTSDSSGRFSLYAYGLKRSTAYKVVFTSVADALNGASAPAYGTPFIFR